MPIKSKRVNLSIPPNRVKSILDAGKRNGWQDTDGALRLTSICAKIVFFFISLYNDDVNEHLKEEGGTLMGLIPRALKYYIDARRDVRRTLAKTKK